MGTADLKDELSRGFTDFTECRTDVVVLCLIYPFLGLVLSRVVFGYDLLPLLFPLASGFALLMRALFGIKTPAIVRHDIYVSEPGAVAANH